MSDQPERPTTGITPFLAIRDGRAKEALGFYERAFAGQIIERNDTPEGKVMQASAKINGGWIMLSDEFPEHGMKVGAPEAVTLHLQVDDADRWYNRAVEAGCTVRMPIADQFWGDRYGMVVDPFGHGWSLGSPLKG